MNYLVEHEIGIVNVCRNIFGKYPLIFQDSSQSFIQTAKFNPLFFRISVFTKHFTPK